MNYYYLLGALPPLDLSKEPPISFLTLKELLSCNLSKQDAKRWGDFLFPLDLYNIKALWLEEERDPRGQQSDQLLEEALLVEEGIPTYLADFLHEYPDVKERVRFFASLWASMYQDLGAREGFLGRYFTEERGIRLWTLALRAKKEGRDLSFELQFEDPQDPQVAEILASKDGAEVHVPRGYETLKSLFVDNSGEPVESAVSWIEERYERVEALEEGAPPFSFDLILGYAARLLLVEELSFMRRKQESFNWEELGYE